MSSAASQPRPLAPAPLPGPAGPANAPPEPGLLDYAQLRHQVSFVMGSVRRHRRLVLLVWALVMGLSGTLAKVWPRTYHVQTKILAQRNQVMAALGNPHRSVPSDADSPTRAASETVLRHDNLVSLVKQTNLLDVWYASRPGLLRLRDQLLDHIRGRPTDQERLDGLVAFLEKRLQVYTGEGTVTISVDWPNAQMAYQLVEAAQQNFLEARHVTEVSTIEEAISILEAHADNVHGAIERTLEEIQKLRTTPPERVAKAAPARPKANYLGLGEVAPEQELSQIRFLLRAKRRAISDLEEFRQKRLTELQAQLAEQRVVYSSQHPVVLDTQQRITALNQDSPQIVELKQQEEQLIEEYRRRSGGRSPDGEGETGPRPPAASDTAGSQVISRGSGDDSPQLIYAKEQLRIATDTYQDILLRIDAARIELDTARAAFKYRYSVIKPAELPRSADRPNVPMMLMTGLLAAVALAVLAAVLQDGRQGRFLHAWQVEEKLNLPVLGGIREL